jgi:hyaluronoglucosaminidase
MTQPNEFLRDYCELTSQSFNLELIQTPALPEESFRISNEKVEFSSLSGLRNAVNVFNQSNARLTPIRDAITEPAFRIRGVIEGFYGQPWSHSQRKKALNFFARHNMNTFILAPKDDPWQRFDWRTPFSSLFLELTQELVELSKKLLIDLNVCVSPGLTVCYSSQEDVDALLVRYRQLHSIGVRRFGLLLDDISGELQYESDRKQFTSIAEAHSIFSNSVALELTKLDLSNSLFVCPLQYHGRGHEPYISELGNKLDKKIDLMWTGRQICSEYLEVFDALKFVEGTTKQPFYWDNYPVNDVAMVHQLHVGPIQKRDADLGAHSVGLVANPMDRFESSLIPLATIADYLWDSKNYNPEQSWTFAMDELIPNKKDREAIRHLFRNCFESCLAVDAAPDFGALLGTVTLAWRTGQAHQAAQFLEEFAAEMFASYQTINASDFSYPELRAEIGPWLTKYKAVAEALNQIATILKQSSFKKGRLVGTSQMANQVRQIRISLAQDPTRIFGDGLDLVLGELATELSAA